MDADLGIDSIKRVEILSALQEKLPDAPPVKPEHLGTLQTLQDVANFLNSHGVVEPAVTVGSGDSVESIALPDPHAPSSSVMLASAGLVDYSSVLLAVVARRRPATRWRCSTSACRWTPISASTRSSGSKSSRHFRRSCRMPPR